MPGVRLGAIVYRRGGSIRQLSSVIIIPLCSALAVVVIAGPHKTNASIDGIGGARRAFMARLRHGMDLHAPSGVASSI